MYAADNAYSPHVCGKLGCLDHLIAKGANLNAQSWVRRRPCCGVAARGVWG